VTLIYLLSSRRRTPGVSVLPKRRGEMTPHGVPTRELPDDPLRLVLQTEADNTPALRLYVESGHTAAEGYCSLALPLKPDFHGS
jgi:hypothetical protein